VLSERDAIELMSIAERDVGGINGASKEALSIEGRVAEGVVDLIELLGENSLPAAGLLVGPSRVMLRSPSNSKEQPPFRGRALVSKLFVALVRGGDGVSRPFSLIGPSGGVLGNIGSAHSKCGVKRPENMAESRRTLRPRGKENFSYVYEEDGPDT
jgi:hypothetical protein